MPNFCLISKGICALPLVPTRAVVLTISIPNIGNR